MRCDRCGGRKSLRVQGDLPGCADRQARNACSSSSARQLARQGARAARQSEDGPREDPHRRPWPTLDAVGTSSTSRPDGLLQRRHGRRRRPRRLALRLGDRVVSTASTRRWWGCRRTWCAKIPENVSDEAAAFTPSPRSGCKAFVSRSRRSAKRSSSRARADRPAVRSAASGERLPCARPRLRPRQARAGASVRRRCGRPRRRRIGRAAEALTHGRGADAVLITARLGSASRSTTLRHVPQARAYRARRRYRTRALARRLLREGADVPGVVQLRAGPIRPQYEERASTIRSASSAGPNSATSRRCST